MPSWERCWQAVANADTYGRLQKKYTKGSVLYVYCEVSSKTRRLSWLRTGDRPIMYAAVCGDVLVDFQVHNCMLIAPHFFSESLHSFREYWQAANQRPLYLRPNDTDLHMENCRFLNSNGCVADNDECYNMPQLDMLVEGIGQRLTAGLVIGIAFTSVRAFAFVKAAVDKGLNYAIFGNEVRAVTVFEACKDQYASAQLFDLRGKDMECLHTRGEQAYQSLHHPEYIKTTSGTTGPPKIITTYQEQLCSLARYRLATSGLAYAETDVVLCSTNPSFDVFDETCFVIMEAWRSGIPVRVLFTPFDNSVTGLNELATVCFACGVTYITMTSTCWRLLTQGFRGDLVTETLRLLILIGEPVATAGLTTACTVFGGYGLTEAGCISSYQEVTDDIRKFPLVPVGAPVTGHSFAIHDKELFISTPDGEVATGDAAVHDEGYIHLKGRLVDDVKVGGTRVRLGETKLRLSEATGCPVHVELSGAVLVVHVQGTQKQADIAHDLLFSTGTIEEEYNVNVRAVEQIGVDPQSGKPSARQTDAGGAMVADAAVILNILQAHPNFVSLQDIYTPYTPFCVDSLSSAMICNQINARLKANIEATSMFKSESCYELAVYVRLWSKKCVSVYRMLYIVKTVELLTPYVACLHRGQLHYRAPD